MLHTAPTPCLQVYAVSLFVDAAEAGPKGKAAAGEDGVTEVLTAGGFDQALQVRGARAPGAASPWVHVARAPSRRRGPAPFEALLSAAARRAPPCADVPGPGRDGPAV